MKLTLKSVPVPSEENHPHTICLSTPSLSLFCTQYVRYFYPSRRRSVFLFYHLQVQKVTHLSSNFVLILWRTVCMIHSTFQMKIKLSVLFRQFSLLQSEERYLIAAILSSIAISVFKFRRFPRELATDLAIERSFCAVVFLFRPQLQILETNIHVDLCSFTKCFTEDFFKPYFSAMRRVPLHYQRVQKFCLYQILRIS